jgi:hypothetical protein
LVGYCFEDATWHFKGTLVLLPIALLGGIVGSERLRSSKVTVVRFHQTPDVDSRT